MSIEVKVPTLPESISDATVLDWHKQPGETVRRDENILDLETDKVVLEVPAPADGVLSKVLAETGTVVKAGDTLAVIEPQAAAPAPPNTEDERPAPPPQPSDSDEPVLTPAVRRLVKELGVDPHQILGSGKDGRITKADVMKYLDAQPAAGNPDLTTVDEQEEGGATASSERREQRVPMTRLRQRIAERLKEAQNTAAILTTFNEVDLQAVTGIRQQHKAAFEERHGVKLGFMSFFVKASIEALKRFPAVNASVDGTDILYHDYFDIGIAVGSERGLVVPVLRDADQLDFAGIEKAIREYARKAREGTLSYDDLNGGTFTITNGGVYGSMLSTPILNPPQSGILGMHNITERPVVVNGEIVIRPMMYLALSYDHRIVDGREAVQFLVTIKQHLEDPGRLLLGL